MSTHSQVLGVSRLLGWQSYEYIAVIPDKCDYKESYNK